MTRAREIRSFDYVNHPYEKVRDALTGDAVSVFRAATRAAASRTRTVAAALRVNVAGIEVGKEISISVHQVEEKAGGATSSPVTHLDLVWEASDSPGLFPVMNAQLSIYPLTATETQLDFRGNYEPPLGWLGSAVNALAGHRIAEASVHRFVSEVAGFLRKTLET
jgi:hypothetical protein